MDSAAQRTIWAVSAGEYDDYRVHAVFERQADAEAYRDRHNLTHFPRKCDAAFVEDFPFFPAGTPIDRDEVVDAEVVAYEIGA